MRHPALHAGVRCQAPDEKVYAHVLFTDSDAITVMQPGFARNAVQQFLTRESSAQMRQNAEAHNDLATPHKVLRALKLCGIFVAL